MARSFPRSGAPARAQCLAGCLCHALLPLHLPHRPAAPPFRQACPPAGRAPPCRSPSAHTVRQACPHSSLMACPCRPHSMACPHRAAACTLLPMAECRCTCRPTTALCLALVECPPTRIRCMVATVTVRPSEPLPPRTSSSDSCAVRWGETRRYITHTWLDTGSYAQQPRPSLALTRQVSPPLCRLLLKSHGQSAAPAHGRSTPKRSPSVNVGRFAKGAYYNSVNPECWDEVVCVRK
mmetsp:Transcript_10109/g.18232  ORF Transcript_10109/g.18232 Transcript_10109/m.18232 type:complete len:237 (-) Transcript_10109:91-801(-)